MMQHYRAPPRASLIAIAEASIALHQQPNFAMAKKAFPICAFARILLPMRPSDALAAHRDELRQLISRYDVTHPRVYGSVLTGKDDEESDLDLLVDATPSTTLYTLAGLEHDAEELLGVHVSVLTPGFLSRKFRDRVLQQAQTL